MFQSYHVPFLKNILRLIYILDTHLDLLKEMTSFKETWRTLYVFYYLIDWTPQNFESILIEI